MRKRLKTVFILGMFTLQLAFLSYRQQAFDDSMMRMTDVEEQRLIAEGLPRNQAVAIVSVANIAADRAAAYAQGMTLVMGITSFVIILAVLSTRGEEKS